MIFTIFQWSVVIISHFQTDPYDGTSKVKIAPVNVPEWGMGTPRSSYLYIVIVLLIRPKKEMDAMFGMGTCISSCFNGCIMCKIMLWPNNSALALVFLMS